MTIDELGQQLAGLRVDLVRANPPQVMNPEEAATFLGVTTETLFRWRKDRFGPPYSQPTSRVVRYLRDDVVAWMREQG
ncbi:helix-turn-helix transcriptional regulator [Ruegeria sp.]|uniref:helix-turn-helix transcriptional regulator n=1 Tax=Ruegeria sp. TaxID=1879320 RepID=UPI003B5CDDA3